VPHKFCCAPRAPAVRNFGARAPTSSMAPAPVMVVTLEVQDLSTTLLVMLSTNCRHRCTRT